MISDFKAGTKVCQAVLLRVQKIGNSSNGGVFARGLLEDNSGKMPFIVFEAGIVDKMRSVEGPKVMMVGGMVDINKFSNDMTLQLVLQRMEEIMPEDDIPICCLMVILIIRNMKISCKNLSKEL